MTDEELIAEARRRAAAKAKYPLNRANILRGKLDDKSSVLRELRVLEHGGSIKTHEEALQGALDQIHRVFGKDAPSYRQVIERIDSLSREGVPAEWVEAMQFARDALARADACEDDEDA